MRAIPGLVELELVEERLLLDERQDRHPPAQQGLAVLAADVGRKVVVRLVESCDSARPICLRLLVDWRGALPAELIERPARASPGRPERPSTG